jgi:thiol:disulfide interchange protein
MHQPRVQKLPYLLSLALLGLIFGSCLGMSGSAIAATATSPLPAITSANAADDLLPPEQAFAISARFRDAKTIELNYKIADGYYMYRKRFRVASESPAFKIAKIVTPTGAVKQDATFGRVETYRKSVRVLLPTTRLSRAVIGSDEVIKVAVTSQGCAVWAFAIPRTVTI